MNITKQTIEGLNGLITIQLDPQDYKPAIQEALKKYAKKANIPGFRPGMAPIGMIKRMVGKSIAIDAITSMVNREMDAYLDENQLDLIGQPLPTEQKEADYFDEDATRSLEFGFEVGFAPKVELNMTFPDPITRYEIEVDDEFAKGHLERLRTRFGQPQPVETVEANDYLFVRFDEVDADGNVVEGGFNTHASINPDKVTNAAAFAPLLGKKADDTLIYDINLLGSHDDIAKLLFTDHDTVHDLLHKKLQLTVRRINRNMPAEINGEFIQNVIGAERAQEIETEEQLLAEMKKDMKNQLEKEADWVFRFYLKKALTAQNEVELPATFLRKWLLATQEKINETNVDHELGHTLENLRWQAITEEIISRNPEMKVQQADIEASVREEILEMMGGNVDDAMMEQYVAYMFKQEEIVRKHIGRALDNRVFAFLENLVTTTKQNITASEFAKLEIN